MADEEAGLMVDPDPDHAPDPMGNGFGFAEAATMGVIRVETASEPMGVLADDGRWNGQLAAQTRSWGIAAPADHA